MNIKGSTLPLLSTSLVEINKGVSGDIESILFFPKLPKRKSKSPSLSKSVASIERQRPYELSNVEDFKRSKPFFLFKKIVIGLYSPTSIKSFLPSLLISVQLASVTIPKGFKGGKISSVTSSKNPLLFLNKKFSSDKGYAPGLL